MMGGKVWARAGQLHGPSVARRLWLGMGAGGVAWSRYFAWCAGKWYIAFV